MGETPTGLVWQWGATAAPVVGVAGDGREHWALAQAPWPQLEEGDGWQQKKEPLDEMFDEDPRAQNQGVGSRNQHPGMK